MKRLISVALLLYASSSFATVVQPVGAASQVLIPAAGSTAGANGTFFRSDITIINLTTHDQSVALQWLPQAGTGATNSTTVITIPAQSGIRSSDFVAQYLSQTGLGSIIIRGIVGNAIDPSAALYVSSRIWTPQVGTNGTTSQSFPAIPLTTINTPIAALFGVGGADNPSNYRVNVGIVNLDPNSAQVFIVSIPPSTTGTIVSLPPLSMQQISLGSGVSSTTQISIQNATINTPTTTRSNLWTAYSSTVDNTTGDAWSEIALTGTTP